MSQPVPPDRFAACPATAHARSAEQPLQRHRHHDRHGRHHLDPRLADAPGNVRLSRRASRLPKPSVVNVAQVVTLNETDLEEHVASLDTAAMAEIDDGLLLSLAL